MNKEKLDELTKEWILTLLYGKRRNLDYLIEYGCKIMIFGHNSYEDIEQIIQELVDEKKIAEYPHSELELTSRGKFIVKKNTIIPLLTIATDKKFRDAFILANQEKCDIEFLEHYVEAIDQRIGSIAIHDYSKNDFLPLKMLTATIIRFISENPEFAFQLPEF